MSYARINLKQRLLKSKNKKNPINRDLSLDELLILLPNTKILKDGIKNVYSFNLNRSTTILGKKLPPGSFVLKYYAYANVGNINHLITLSQYKLIPKIYIITSKFIIMKYIKGVAFRDLSRKISKTILEIILNNLEQAIILWHKLGFFHGDIGFDGNNIIVDMDTLDVYLIDPLIDDLENIRLLTSSDLSFYFEKDLRRVAWLRDKILYNKII